MNTKENEKIKNEKSGGCCCSGKTRNTGNDLVAETNNTDLPLHVLAVNGASCGGCVGKIERALLSIYGVEKAQMNLQTGTAIVSGDVAIETLIRALEDVGFSASKAE
ncbi:MAG: heavy metal-associated domain-containing protein [Pseudomonadales bacterium]|nr:heavy metal-associated domain-containing protein [Pseudomonadales bacterium]